MTEHAQTGTAATNVKPLDLTPPGKAPKAPVAPGANGKPAKEAKAPKEPKAPAEPRVSRFAKLYPDTATIKFLVEGNPKRGAAGERYEAYMKTTNVKDFLAAGGTYSDIAWNIGHGLMVVTV
jgi:hypothetical protein